MIKSTVFRELKPSEIECSLQDALNNPLIKQFNYMWVVSGQYINNESLTGAMTYVAKSISDENFTVCIITNGKRLHLKKSFSESELKEYFPKLFSVIGQLVSI